MLRKKMSIQMKNLSPHFTDKKAPFGLSANSSLILGGEFYFYSVQECSSNSLSLSLKSVQSRYFFEGSVLIYFTSPCFFLLLFHCLSDFILQEKKKK